MNKQTNKQSVTKIKERPDFVFLIYLFIFLFFFLFLLVKENFFSSFPLF
jgi:hypothetical protein